MYSVIAEDVIKATLHTMASFHMCSWSTGPTHGFAQCMMMAGLHTTSETTPASLLQQATMHECCSMLYVSPQGAAVKQVLEPLQQQLRGRVVLMMSTIG
jgi:hypothetical protein